MKRAELPSDVGLLARDAAEEELSRCRQRRTLQRRSSDAVVEKMVRDNFRGWSETASNSVAHDGMSLRDRLRYDKQRQQEGAPITLGNTYYASLEAEYAPPGHATKLLQVQNPTEPICPNLVDALSKARRQSPMRSALSSWLGGQPVGNQKTLVGILRFACELKPWQSSPQLMLVQDIMTWLVRHNVAEKSPRTRGHEERVGQSF